MEFKDPLVAGDTLVRAGIQSANYQAGQAGWRIDRAGQAEFSEVALRGSVLGRDYYLGDLIAPDPAGGIGTWRGLHLRADHPPSDTDVEDHNYTGVHFRESPTIPMTDNAHRPRLSLRLDKLPGSDANGDFLDGPNYGLVGNVYTTMRRLYGDASYAFIGGPANTWLGPLTPAGKGQANPFLTLFGAALSHTPGDVPRITRYGAYWVNISVYAWGKPVGSTIKVDVDVDGIAFMSQIDITQPTYFSWGMMLELQAGSYLNVQTLCSLAGCAVSTHIGVLHMGDQG